jgi:PST family polysaccharide transporter
VAESSPSTVVAGGHSFGRVLRNFGAMAMSNVVGQLIGFVALAYVARRVGAANLGAYNFALAIAGYFGLVANLGVPFTGTADVARDPHTMRTVVREVQILQGLLAAAMYLLVVGLAPVIVGNDEARNMVPIVALTFVCTSLTVDWVLFAEGRATAIGVWRMVGQVVYGLGVALIVGHGEAGVRRYAALNVLGLAVTAVGVFIVYLRLRRSVPRAADTTVRIRSVLTRLRRSVPAGYALVMLSIYGGIDMVMLGYLDSSRAVGIYAIANKLPSALALLGALWTGVLMPYAAPRLRDDPRAFASELGKVVTAALVLAIAASCAAICGEGLVSKLFGESFRAAGTPFVILSVAAGLVLVQATLSNVLMVSDGRRYYTIALTIAAALIVALNALLIPLLGIIGSAIATVGGELFITTVTARGVSRLIGPIAINRMRLVRGAAASAAMAGVMITLHVTIGIVPACIGGAIVFPLAAWALAVFDPALWRQPPRSAV